MGQTSVTEREKAGNIRQVAKLSENLTNAPAQIILNKQSGIADRTPREPTQEANRDSNFY